MTFPTSPRPAGLGVVLGALALLGIRGAAADSDYRINVRSAVDRQFKGLSKEPRVAHGQVYAVVKLELIDNPLNKLVRPVNEFALLKNLDRVLAAHGFHEAPPGTNPDLLLTVLYGRGWLKNPYMDDSTIYEETQGLEGFNAFGGRTVTITGIPKDIIRHKDAFYDEKLQRADGEKLIINVTAWAFPDARKDGEKKKRPKQLWHTTINTDDADQDLNAQMEKMLAAGAVYFDRETDKEEETVFSSLPEGHVNVGHPTVVEPAPPKK